MYNFSSILGIIVLFRCDLFRFYPVGTDCPYDKLDAVREQQEELMRLHFELDNKMQNITAPTTGRNRQQARR